MNTITMNSGQTKKYHMYMETLFKMENNKHWTICIFAFSYKNQFFMAPTNCILKPSTLL